jgi:hypothetical protein
MILNDNIYFYSEDGTKFKSKISAIEYSQKTGQQIRFYFHDEVYSKVDWKKELPEDLEYYYKQQALRLREKYDYLVLAYSGGADSTCILETFVHNNIKLDKIVSVGAFSKDSAWGVDENHNGEIYHNVIPYVKELGLESITDIVDYTKYLEGENFKNLSTFQYGSNWIYEIGSFFSVHHFFWRDAERILVNDEWKNKKVGFILGVDKPEVQVIDEKFAIRFSDVPILQYGNSSGFGNVERVRFFWDPDFAEMTVKQVQELKKAGIFGGNQKNIAKALYNLRKPLSFESPKTGNVFWSLRDTYLKDMKDTELFKFYSDGLRVLDSRVGFNAVVPILTKNYHI